MSKAPSPAHRRGACRDGGCPASTDYSRHNTSGSPLIGTRSGGSFTPHSSQTDIAQAKVAGEIIRVVGRGRGWMVHGSVSNGVPSSIPRRDLGKDCCSSSRPGLLIRELEMTCLLQGQAPTLPVRGTAYRFQSSPWSPGYRAALESRFPPADASVFQTTCSGR